MEYVIVGTDGFLLPFVESITFNVKFVSREITAQNIVEYPYIFAKKQMNKNIVGLHTTCNRVHFVKVILYVIRT